MTKRRSVPLAEQIECAIAFGRSGRWIVEHLHCTEADIVAADIRIENAHQGVDNEGSNVAGRTEPKHGTHAGYELHRARHDLTCQECRVAEREHCARKREKATAA